MRAGRLETVQGFDGARVRVLPLSTTNSALPAAAARSGASARPSVGGPSITTRSNASFASAMILRIRPGRQQVRRVRRHRSARQQPQIGMLRLDDMVRDWSSVGQQLAQADACRSPP